MREYIKKILSHKINFKPIDCLIYLFFSFVFVIFLRNKFNDLDNGIINGASIFSAFIVTFFYRLYKNKH